MRLDGIHHITAITADAQRNIDFYVGTLGLRFVKRTVNFDQPDVYHLYYADEGGHPGSVLTFFEFPDAAVGRAGAGMIHRIAWRVGSPGSIAFWEQRLAGAGVATRREGDSLRFADPEGMDLELIVADAPDAPLTAEADDIPEEHRLQGFAGVRAYAAQPEASADLLADALQFTREDNRRWLVEGDTRRAFYHYDTPPAERGFQGAGTVHHIAWLTNDAEEPAWQQRAAAAGARVTPIIDRQYFHSVYFREPSGVLFELATVEPGFDVDEPKAELGESLKLPPQYESRRDRLEQLLTPLVNPRPRSVPAK